MTTINSCFGRSSIGVNALLLYSLAVVWPARAELWLDPEAPMTWEQMLACELVVVARYESHKGDELTLHVIDTVKGSKVPGRPLVLRLQHLYTIETGHVGWDAFMKKDTEPDGIPKLCYKRQIMNPGDLVPCSVLEDVREAALYFIPKTSQPVLNRPRQLQPTESRSGWQQAIKGQPIDLMFRLTQDVSSDLSRAALEDLGRSRDGKCLDRLFELVLSPPRGSQFRQFDATIPLGRLGNVDGDVYNRAAKLLSAAAPGTNEYRFFPLATLMAIADEHRAGIDLPKLVADKMNTVAVRKAAVNGLGRVCSKEAAQLALESLRDPEVGETAVHAIRTLLSWGDDDYRFPKSRGLNDREWLVAEVRQEMANENSPANVKKSMRDWLGNAFREPVKLDIEALRVRLLDRNDRTYNGWADGETADMLRRARESFEPRLIPVLAEVLEKVPAASGNRGYAFQETLKLYANVCPRAMRRELEQRGLPARLAAIPSHERSFLVRQSMESTNLWSVNDPSRPEVDRCYRLAEQVREGKVAEAELLVATDGFVAKYQMSGLTAQTLGSLLKAGSPAARERFFEYVADAKQARTYPFFHEPRLSGNLIYFLHHLFPSEAPIYFEQVVELLRSESLLERKAGVESLGYTLGCDFEFDPDALEADRSRRLTEILPWLKRLEGKTEIEAKVILLERAGIQVEGEIGDKWLNTLVPAVGTNNKGAVAHALFLIEQVVGEKRCRQFAHLPVEQRHRVLYAYLDDAGKLPM